MFQATKQAIKDESHSNAGFTIVGLVFITELVLMPLTLVGLLVTGLIRVLQTIFKRR